MVQNPLFSKKWWELFVYRMTRLWVRTLRGIDIVKATFHEPTDQKFEHPRIREWFDRHRPPQGCITLFIFTGNHKAVGQLSCWSRLLSIVYCGWLCGGFVIH